MKLIERQKDFMKTVITIKVVQHDEPTVVIQDRIEEAFGEFERIVQKYTRFEPTSELSILNSKSGEWVELSDEFCYLVDYMLTLAEKTNGVFDPTIIDILEAYGYDPKYDFSKLDDPYLAQKIENLVKTRPSFREIEFDKLNKKIKLVKGQRIELGGIGKGYAIDCAFNRMKKDISNFLIDAGGDIRAIGKNENDELWNIALKNKKDGVEEIVGYIKLDNASIASSGSWARKVKHFHHLIDPTTGKPSENFSTVYVKADTAIVADSWATAVFVGGDKITQVLPPDIQYHLV